MAQRSSIFGTFMGEIVKEMKTAHEDGALSFKRVRWVGGGNVQVYANDRKARPVKGQSEPRKPSPGHVFLMDSVCGSVCSTLYT